MSQVFRPYWNVIAPVATVSMPVALVAVGALAMAIERSPYVTKQGVMASQVVPFSHKHHAGELGIDCRFCHQSVETEAFAGMPATSTCMKCHSQIWPREPMLAPVRDSYRTGAPIRWTRVHDLPDYVYFNHSVHVAKGVGCSTCHGRVDQMPMMTPAHALHMQWCLDCHRAPAGHIRPVDEVFNMQWSTKSHEVFHDQTPTQAPQVSSVGLTNCSTCHR